MKQKLSFKEYIYVASMLFGMFFGAGNLIFRFIWDRWPDGTCGRPFLAS